MPSAYLWCPAYPLVDEQHRQRTVTAAKRLTEAAGYTLTESPLLARTAGAGAWLDAEVRIPDLINGMGCSLLIAARGGYGCLDLIESMLAWPKTSAPRLVGFSDVTVLHAIWWRRGWGETLYGFMPGVAGGNRARETALTLLRGDSLALSERSDPGAAVIRPGTAKGIIFAGCLRVLAGLIGTPVMPNLDGCILAIEDIDERPYRIDRDLQQLARSGSFRGLAGLVCGTFPCDLAPAYGGPSARDLLTQWADRLKVPALFGLPFGHAADPITLPCGRPAILDCQASSWSLVVTSCRDDGAGLR